MLSYKDFKKLNESLLGPVTLGLKQIPTVGVVGGQLEEKKCCEEKPEEEEKDEKEPEEEDTEKKDGKWNFNKGKEDKKDEKPCKKCDKSCKKTMTKEDTDWWNSVHDMMSYDPNEKGWDGIGPAQGEPGFSPTTRFGIGEDVSQPVSPDGASGGPEDSGPPAPEGGEEAAGGIQLQGVDLEIQGNKLLVKQGENSFDIELTPEQMGDINDKAQKMSSASPDADTGGAETGGSPQAPGGPPPGGPPGGAPPAM
jgi:hypothetical protein